MATYIAFLRAINVGGRRTFPKTGVIKATEAAGFVDVVTHLNTGNVRFDTTLRSRAKIEQALETAYEAEAGFEVPTIVFSRKELREIADAAESIDHDGQHYVSLLKQRPTQTGLARVNHGGKDGERAEATGRAVHLLLGPDYHSAKLSNPVVEKHLGVATNRNVRVIRTLAEKWC